MIEHDGKCDMAKQEREERPQERGEQPQSAEYWRQVAKDAMDSSDKFRKEAAMYKRTLDSFQTHTMDAGIDKGKYEERIENLKKNRLPSAGEILDLVLEGKLELGIVIRKSTDGRGRVEDTDWEETY